MKAKSLITAILSLVLIVAPFSGCSGGTTGTSSNASTAKKVTFPLSAPITMTMLAVQNGAANVSLDTTDVWKYYEQKTNVKWQIQSVPAISLVEKRNLMLASDQYPDVLFKSGIGQADLDKYGKQGTFIPLNKYFDNYAPNLTKVLNDAPVGKKAITSPDGNIYSFIQASDKCPSGAIYWINKVWMTKLGLKEPTNADELYAVLKAFKEKDPNGNGKADEIPFTASTVSGATLSPMMLAPYFGMTWDLTTNTALINGKFQYAYNSTNYKELLAFTTKLYKDGLMDKNSFVQTFAQQNAVGASGDIYGSFFASGAFQTVGRTNDRNFAALTPFQKGVYAVNPDFQPGALVITDKCKYPDIVAAWADYFYTEEGGRFIWMGIENQTYKINLDGTWDWILGNFKDTSSLRATTIQGSAVIPSLQPKLWSAGMTDPNEKYLSQERNRLYAIGAKPFPVFKLSDDEVKTVASIKADIDAYIAQYQAKVVIGQLNLDSSWSDYNTTLKNMGLQKMMDIYTKAYTAATK